MSISKLLDFSGPIDYYKIPRQKSLSSDGRRMRPARLRGTLGWICSSCQKRAFLKQAPRSAPPRGKKLPDTPARTRFAPSPTGNLHLGSIRTALFNYLLAKRSGGEFLLRIEDTDQKRTIPGAEERICEDLRWVGLLWDEGPTIGGPYGPYKQSERKALYHQHIQPLLASRAAYRCFCSPERIDELNRSRQERGLPLGYDRHCTDIFEDESNERAHQGHSHVIRFIVPDDYPKYDDFVYGRTGQGKDAGRKLHVDQPVYDDPVLMKSDGYPTYHFANVVDDHLMNITHVIRGSEWMSSTPLHVALSAALGWGSPSYGHVPLLVNQDGQKLSKRHSDLDVSSFRNQDVFPDAFVNFAALLGWSHQGKRDVMTLQQLGQVFDLKFTKGNTIVAFDKLLFLQRQHASQYILQEGEVFQDMVHEVARAIERTYNQEKIQALLRGRKLEGVVATMLQAGHQHYTSSSNFAKRSSIYFEPVLPTLDFGKVGYYSLQTLSTAATALCLVPNESWIAAVHRQNALSLQPDDPTDFTQGQVHPGRWKKEFYDFLRQVLLGSAPGPSIFEVMEILGKDVCTERIRSAALTIRSEEALRTKPKVKLTNVTALGRDPLQPVDHV